MASPKDCRFLQDVRREIGRMDQLMMVLVGGRGRTLDEFSGMASEAGLEVKSVGRQAAGRVIVECRTA